MLNTQGGPRRNEKGQIVRPNGTPIPRLYSAGELGSIYSYLYQGTGNIGECLAFGRISGRNAATETPWDRKSPSKSRCNRHAVVDLASKRGSPAAYRCPEAVGSRRSRVSERSVVRVGDAQNVNGIIGCQIVAQFPNSLQQHVVWVAGQRKIH